MSNKKICQRSSVSEFTSAKLVNVFYIYKGCMFFCFFVFLFFCFFGGGLLYFCCGCGGRVQVGLSYEEGMEKLG